MRRTGSDINLRFDQYTLIVLCVCVRERVRHRLWGTCNNRTIVPRKEIQWHNGTPQEKF